MPVSAFGMPTKGSDRPSALPMPSVRRPCSASMRYSATAEVAVPVALPSTLRSRAAIDARSALSRGRRGTPSHSARTVRSVGEVASQFDTTCTKVRPSMVPWCALPYSATLPPSRPSMTHRSHSSRERSSRVSCSSHTVANSCSKLPGGGSVRRCRCSAGSVLGSTSSDGTPISGVCSR